VTENKTSSLYTKLLQAVWQCWTVAHKMYRYFVGCLRQSLSREARRVIAAALRISNNNCSSSTLKKEETFFLTRLFRLGSVSLCVTCDRGYKRTATNITTMVLSESNDHSDVGLNLFDRANKMFSPRTAVDSIVCTDATPATTECCCFGS
jgi:hypothetical protein